MRSALVLATLTGIATAEPVDFIDDAKLLYRVAACGTSDAPVDAKLAKIVDRHCKWVTDKLEKFRAEYFVKNREWFATIVPKTAPKTVVYPFGGGDLLSALVAFPDATDITTISLELAGDPRRLRTLAPAALDIDLGALRNDIGGLLDVGSNTTVKLSSGQQNDLPAQVSSFLLALVAGGYEPIAMRYFTLDDTGTIHYLDQSEVAAADKQPRKKDGPSFSKAFSNVEIEYRKIGDTTVRVHRHIGWNLDNDYLRTHPQLLRFLDKKGQVTMLVKGASYLLWRSDFSRVREYILDHLAWMLSDSTGVPPAFARPAGMVQETYGYYKGAFLVGSQASPHDEDFIKLWATQKRRRLPFRFGYVDTNKQAHLVVTRPRGS